MPEWWQVLAAVAGTVASWRWVLRPIRRAYAALVRLVDQLRDVSSTQQALAEMAGALTQYAVATLTRLDDHDEQLAALADRCGNLSDLLLEMVSDVHDLNRQQRKEHHDRPQTTD